MKWWQFKKRDADLERELCSDLELEEEEQRENGLPPEEARYAARRAFGNATLIREQTREVWHWTALESLLMDLRLVLRRLARSPGFAATVLLTLAIGIGANTAVFSVLNSVILRPLPYPDSDRLVSLWLNAPGAPGMSSFNSGLQISPSMFFTFSERNQTFQSLGVFAPSTANVTGLAQPEEVHTVAISDGVLQTLAVPTDLGRWFTQTDQDPHGAKTVLLSYGYWQRRFGADPHVIGHSIQVDAQTREIAGVMPRGFRMVDRDFDLLLPLAFDRANLKLAPFGYEGIGRLKPGLSLQQADADVARLIPVWMDSWSNGPGTNPHYYRIWRITPAFLSLKQQVIGSVSSTLWVVMATVGLVMLIACTNVANLQMVRAESRQQELSVRAALGAGPGRIMRELLTESVFLGVLGGAVAVGVAFAGLRLLVTMGPADLPRLSEVALDARSLLFTAFLSILSGLLFGAIPALRYARSEASALMGGANRTASADRARQRGRNGLVVAQVAMALVLLISALLMIRTLQALRNVEPGFTDPAHVQTMSLYIPELLVADSRNVTRIQNDIVDKISAISGVMSVGFAGSVPMDNNDPNWDEIAVEGKNYEGGNPPIRLFNYVSPRYFSTMGTKLVAGRDFTWSDIYGLRPRIIVSENFARESWGSASVAVGKRVRQFSSMPWQEVIGVVQDVRQHGVDEKAPPTIYWPSMLDDPYSRKPAIESARAAVFVIRSDRAGSESFINQVQQAVWSVNGNLPLASVQTMQDLYSHSMARTSFTLVMLAIAGSMALVLGIIGIYGVISYAVSQRTREIGIRLALGAQKSELKWMFVRSALMLTGMGIAIGVGAAAALMQLMKSLLFGISPLDPLTYIAVPIMLAASAAIASYLPARRAASIDPMRALRSE
jgi:predicted permease